MALSSAAAIVFGLAGAFFVDYWQGITSSENQLLGFSLVLIAGALSLGMASPFFISRMPEPLMPAQERRLSLRILLKEPFQDVNFRQLLNFLFFWDFATSLALPFFTIYMLRQMGLPLWSVVGLNMLSQLTGIIFLRLWGPFSDRFGSKTILSICGSLQILVIQGWAAVTFAPDSPLVLFLLVGLQVFAGAASAGTTLTASILSIKLSPQDKATAYLAVLSLVTSLGSGLGPLVGGFLADYFSVHQIVIGFQWISPNGDSQLPSLHLVSFTLLFSLASLIGLITLNALTTIKEEGEARREDVLAELVASTHQISRTIGSFPALRLLSQFAYGRLRHIPGLDVAVGITTHEIAAAARATADAIGLGRSGIGEVADTPEVTATPGTTPQPGSPSPPTIASTPEAGKLGTCSGGIQSGTPIHIDGARPDR
ncbi:MAG TPA: MFS transporter [Dehalococcoidia bacterium]|nr:MFS transporter [Dehalococcoidia bacterium]